MQETQITLNDGTSVKGIVFDNNDYQKMKQIFRQCMDISDLLRSLGGRKLNIPDVISEGIYCVLFNAARTNGDAYSYDAVDLSTKEGIQIKSASIANDCTSFGPTSTWDKLIFMDFAPKGIVDGNVDFYEIPSEDVYGLVLNQSKHETFIDQQKQGRRPRFSIKKLIISPKNIKPFAHINLLEDTQL